MRSLFLKIFLWFWLSLVLITLVLEVMTSLTHYHAQEVEWQNQAFVASEALRCVDIYEREGAEAVKKHLQTLPKRPMNAYLLDDHGAELLGQTLPKELIQLAEKGVDISLPAGLLGLRPDKSLPAPPLGAEAHKSRPALPQEPEAHPGEIDTPFSYAPIPPKGATAKHEPDRFVRSLDSMSTGNFERIVAEHVVGASGRSYTFLMLAPRFSMKTFMSWLNVEVAVRIGAVLLVAGIFCLWLARHITSPVSRLRQAANKISAGDLSARASAGLRKRHDEIGALSQQFDHMADRIESLLADHERLLSTVSHELRSPLTRLSVAAALLKQCPEEEKLEYVERIELETEQLNKLIAQLLTLSRIESGMDMGSRKEVIDLASLVQEVAADGNFEAQARSCSVSVRAVDPCVTTGVIDQVRRAIENVVRNAIRHTKTNSEVEITMQRQQGASSAKAIVRVRDHGPGVPDSDLEKIFQPFYRVTLPDGSNSDGSGLGLAITDRIARTHGGSVRALNAQDGGLLVELELPLTG